MNVLVQYINSIKPITRAWAICTISSAILVKAKVVNQSSFYFLPEMLPFVEPWRFITSFLYFGSLSKWLIFVLLLSTKTLSEVESQFLTRKELFPDDKLRTLTAESQEKLNSYIDRHRSIDYLYFLLIVNSTILILDAIGYLYCGRPIKLLAPLTHQSLSYFWCQDNPNRIIRVLLFDLRALYFPLVQTLVNFPLLLILSSRSEKGNLDFLPTMRSLLFNSYTWQVFVSYSAGHFWWFTRNFLLSKFYNDNDDNRRYIRLQNPKRYVAQDHGSFYSNIYRRVMTYILVPPWYWFYIESLVENQA